MFSPIEADLIQKISLSCGCSKDVLYWPYVQSGQYSVKLGYFFLKSDTRCHAVLNHVLPAHTKTLWKRIWKLLLPGKIKNFLWKASRNALPTMSNLVRRCVIDDPTCPHCTNQHEDVSHALWNCPSLSSISHEDP